MTEFYDELDFTQSSWDILYDAVDSKAFQDKDADLIFSALQKRMRVISFGEYLRRYIHRRADFTVSFEEVELSDYQKFIKDSFAQNNVPASFEPTTAKLSALSKNWLTQLTVKRKVVFLLGFGLGMSVGDVNELLNKALRERGLNAKDPFEVICWFCYRNHLGYAEFERLWNDFLTLTPQEADYRLISGNGFDGENETIGMRSIVDALKNENELLSYVTRLKAPDNQLRLSVSARNNFRKLYDRACEIVAELYNQEKISDQGLLKGEKAKRIWKSSDVTESDLEHVISSAIPMDQYGNLSPIKASSLNEQFVGKRFNRQHVCDVLAGKAEVNRFDLITLNFFIYSQSLDQYPNAKTRFISFIDSTNDILAQCCLGELFVSNPYECFVLMCILSEEPLLTYADVWQKSYEEPQE